MPWFGISTESFDCDAPFVIVFSTFSAAVAGADRAQSVLRASKASAVRLMKSEVCDLLREGITGRAFRGLQNEWLISLANDRALRLQIPLAAFRQSRKLQRHGFCCVHTPVP